MYRLPSRWHDPDGAAVITSDDPSSWWRGERSDLETVTRGNDGLPAEEPTQVPPDAGPTLPRQDDGLPGRQVAPQLPLPERVPRPTHRGAIRPAHRGASVGQAGQVDGQLAASIERAAEDVEQCEGRRFITDHAPTGAVRGTEVRRKWGPVAMGEPGHRE